MPTPYKLWKLYKSYRSYGLKTSYGLIQTRVMVFKSVNELSTQYFFELFVAISTNACYNLRRTTTDLKLPKKNFL